MLASALISEGIKAYDGRNYKKSLELYQSALNTDGGDQLRAYNGVYLAKLKLGRGSEVTEAFRQLLDHSFKTNRLGIRFLFQPGKTAFVQDKRLSAQYPMWIAQLASQLNAGGSCLQIVGHTSPTGSEPKNLTLSGARSDAIKARLVRPSSRTCLPDHHIRRRFARTIGGNGT